MKAIRLPDGPERPFALKDEKGKVVPGYFRHVSYDENGQEIPGTEAITRVPEKFLTIPEGVKPDEHCLIHADGTVEILAIREVDQPI